MRFVISALMMTAGMTPAFAGDMQWSFRRGDGRAILVWETPDTDDQLLGFSCDKATRQLTVFYNAAPADIQDGASVLVTFSSEAEQGPLAMQAREEPEIGGMSLRTETRMTQQLMRVLSGRTLTVGVQGQIRQIPLAGSAGGVAALVRGCGGR